MNNSIISISLDLHGETAPPIIKAKQGDTARTLCFHLAEGIKSYHIAPKSYAILTAKKPDGTSLLNDCIIEDDTIIYPFTEQTASCTGETHAELSLYSSYGRFITTIPFTLDVYPNVFTKEDAVKSENEQTALNSLITLTLAVKDQTNDLKNLLQEKLDNGELNGESAYNLAVQNGFLGTEQEWLSSLRYDHSEEFLNLADQTRQSSAAAAEYAANAQEASQKASSSEQSAKTHEASAQKFSLLSERAANQASQSEATSMQYAQDAEQYKNSAINSSVEAKSHADNAALQTQLIPDTFNLANAILKKVSGTEISIEDISPVIHNLHCELTSLNEFDCSKLWGQNPITPYQNGIQIEAGIYYAAYKNHTLSYLCPRIHAGDQITFFFHSTNTVTPYFRVSNPDKNIYSGDTVIIQQSQLDSGLVFYGDTTSESPTYITDFMFIKGKHSALDYTPYISDFSNITLYRSKPDGTDMQSIHPAVSGKIEGLLSLYPALKLSTDSPGALIQLIYPQDTTKVFTGIIDRLTVLENSAVGI